MEGTPNRPAVSERDREYMRRMGEFKARSHRFAYERHMELSLADRLRLSERKSQEYRTPERVLKQAEAKADEMRRFYKRAKDLGVYRT
jgi:hypothetical protein